MTLVDLFRRQAIDASTLDAISFADSHMSYQALDDDSNQLAHLMMDKGISPGDKVALCAHRSKEMVVAILAILKCGAAYVPIAPDFPEERKRYICQAAEAKVLISDNNYLNETSARLLQIDLLEKISSKYPILAPAITFSPESTAYILFTSGSTGEPKGVCMPHNALVNLLLWQEKQFDKLRGSSTLQFSKFTFDVSFQEIFSTLTTGGTLHLVDEETVKDPLALLRLIDRNQINRLFLPFVSLQSLAHTAVTHELYPTSLKAVITAGEQLKITNQVKHFFSNLNNTTLFNQYGPTEAHVVSQLALKSQYISNWPALPSIGYSIDNVELIILDENDQLVPYDEEGELYIAGVCLASGYLNHPDLTQEKFKTLSTIPDKPSLRAYKTGDIAKISADGEVTFLGRRDDQVKIRGHRIELGEVEAILGKFTAIYQVAVLAKTYDDGQKYLVAYYIPSENQQPSQKQLIDHLAKSLPEYMIPTIFFQMEAFPKTTSGKIDRKLLPDPINKRENIEAPIVPAKTELEKKLSLLFQKALHFDKIGTSDNFFEFGGNSLLVQKLSNDIRIALGLTIAVTSIYQYPTVKELTAYLCEDDQSSSRTNTLDTPSSSKAVAIVGLAGRFPGAEDIATFWENLIQGKESITHFTNEELDSLVPEELRKDKNYVKARGIIENADKFDHSFFGITPNQAALMDPQQRLFLEVAWELLEKTQQTTSDSPYKTGVFAGTNNNTYYYKNLLSNPDLIEQNGALQIMTLNEKDYIATRTAYQFDLTGPAISVYSACSTSLLAVAQAVQSIRAGQCVMAIAGGSTITAPIKSGHLYQEGAIFSKDGHCKPFDATASGTIFSDGAAAIMLKDLNAAIRDGDKIYATIKGIGINNDGNAKGSFSAPSIKGQADVIKAALQDGKVSPASIGYIEAHGTATPLGDPIEIEGLKMAFGKHPNKHFCSIGSIKSNFGHLTAAAGATGLIKTVLSLHHQKRPATLGFKQLNPQIDLKDSPFYINGATADWKGEFPRRAGVSSFGIGGTNVHVILEEYQHVHEISDVSTSPYHLLSFSAKTENSLELYKAKLHRYVQSASSLNLADLSYSINTKLRQFPHKSYLSFKDKDDLLLQLESKKDASTRKKAIKQLPQNTVFVFPGQGAQYLNMGKDLFESASVFREALMHCAALFDGFMDKPLLDIIYPAAETDQAEAILKNTRYTQPAIFAIEYALAQQWMAWGFTPSSLVGHSIGEFVAAHLAGVFSLEDATRLVAIRGQLVADLPNGDMLSVRAPYAKLEHLIREDISLAAINAPNLCVLAGPSAAITKISAQLDQENILYRKLFTSHAFHSSMMDPVLDSFGKEVEKIKLNPPLLPMISTVTGQPLTDQEATSTQYWTDHLRKAVLFAPAIEHLLADDPNTVFLEIGPGNVLSTLIKQQHQAKNAAAVNSIHRQSEKNHYHELLDNLGKMIIAGIQPDWARFYSGQKRNRLDDIPTYAFDRKRCWIDPLPKDFTTQQLTQTSTRFNKKETTTKHMRTDIIRNKAIGVLESLSGLEISSQSGDSSFLELGLDSLLLTQLSFALKKEFGLPISFRQLNSHINTVDALVDFLDQGLPTDQFQPAPESISSPSSPPAPPSENGSTQAIAPPASYPSAHHQSAIGLIGQQLELLSKQLALLQSAPIPITAQQPSAHLNGNGHVNAPVNTNGTEIKLTKEEVENLKKPFGATARIDKKDHKLPEKQQKFITDFTKRYTSKTASSKAYTQKNRRHMADPRVVSGFNPSIKETVYSLVVNRSKGSRIWDIDGNEYLDILNGFGSILFGHKPVFIDEALKAQIDKGYEIGPQHELSGEVCKLICDITGHDRSALCNTGSEAVMGALRIARTITQRSLVVAFNGSYHGIFDEVIVRGTKSLSSFPAAAGIMPEAVENILILDYGTEETLRIIAEKKDEIAAVLVEPVQSRRPEFQPIEFLKKVREITSASGSALIFDEVITGFRMHPQGAQAIFGIKADLTTYGKVVGGGLPIGVIAGKTAFMDALDGGHWQYGDASVPEIGVTYFAGTFVRHPLALATAKASLEHIQQDNGKLQKNLAAKIQRLADGLNEFFQDHEIPAYVANFGSLWKIKFQQELPYTELLFATFREQGLHIYDGFPCFATAAYQDEDIDKIIEVIKSGFKQLASATFWDDIVPGLSESVHPSPQVISKNQPPVPGAKLGQTQEGKAAWFIPDPHRPGKYLQLAFITS
ncbi:amino acid adenylation domain-containing protein [Echinicola soli]|uniref:Amino acid adenylation domain-containing protein n=2 Tax=Echinicola soli TaxID=2591634 RepID=A0A514CP22_9BACT|nr:amino acid adenylation domain-containing protein [Echinicola soli]